MVIDEISAPPSQEIYTHEAANKIIRDNWNECWKCIWEAEVNPATKGKGSRRNYKGIANTDNEAKDDAARASYDNQRENDRAEKNAKWEKIVADWEKTGEISGKGGSSEDGGKQNKGKTNWVFIPNKIGGNKHKVYPYDFNFLEFGN